MRFILIGNYPPDNQESMKKYTSTLYSELLKVGVSAEIWKPKVLFGAGRENTTHGMAKWLGYIDKWLLFPIILKLRLLSTQYRQPNTFFHICDHSNSPYLPHLPYERTGITCHDVLAIRGAFGFEDAYCPASRMGKILQQWILSNLVKAKILTCVSQLTFNQLAELIQKHHNVYQENICGWKVIPNSFNANFWPMAVEEKKGYLNKLNLNPSGSFILHVGSSLARKNRRMLIEMVSQLGANWTGLIYFAGQPLEESLIAYAKEKGIEKRIVSIIKPSQQELVALYSSCEAFVFPSFSEGFGWPLIEAQACGAPVIASSVEPMPEVSNQSALHADPYRPEEFAAALTELQSPKRRKEIIAAGYNNCKRFDPKIIIRKFLEMYIVGKTQNDVL